MKVFWLVCLTLFALVAAQHDHLAEQRTALNLQEATLGTTYHREYTASVTAQSIEGRNCEDYVHRVTSLRTPQTNEEASFSINVELSATLTGGIYITLTHSNGTVIPFSEVRGNSATGINDYTVRCEASSCLIDYYCALTTQELNVEITTDCATGTIQTSTVYSITFTEYIELIQTIPPSRSLSLSSGTIVSYNPNNHASKNFVQFFHNLVPTVPETNAASRLVIQATLTNTATSVICYSYQGISITRANTGSISSSIEGAGISDDFCNEIICRQATGSTIFIEIPACNVACDLNTNLWIGVGQTNIENTFLTAINVTLFYNTDEVKLPTVTQINAAKWETEGFLTNGDRCDVESGDFTCAQFYSFTLGSIGFNTANINRALSPLVKVTLYGVFNGEVEMNIQRNAISGFGSLECACDTPLTCTVSDGYTDVNECTLSLSPCDWTTALTDEWVISLSSTDPIQYSSLYPTSYGLRFESSSYSLTNVPVSSWITPYRSSIGIEDVHIYKFDFTESDISRDSILVAEFFTDLAQEDIVFTWDYDLDTCTEPEGACFPHGTTNDDNHAFNSCRFFFTPCDGCSPGAEGIYGDIRGVLKAGSLYFYVYFDDIERFSPSRAFGRTVDYTIRFHLRKSSPIYEGKTNVLTVYNEELSPQYYVDVPNDETIARVRVIVSNTFGGEITSYINIDDFAGECSDCFTNIDGCSSRAFSYVDYLFSDGYFPTSLPDFEDFEEDGLFDCEILLPGCIVQGHRIYIASKYVEGGLPFRPENDHRDDPIGYTLTVQFDYVSQPQSIEASRVGGEIIGEIGIGVQTIAGYLDLKSFNQGFLDFDNTRFFKLDLTNTDLKSSDVLRFALSFTALFQNQYKTSSTDADYEMLSTNFMGLSVSDIGYSFDWLSPEQYSSAFCNEEARTCLAATNTAFYLDPQIDFGQSVSSEFFSECTIVIQSCENEGSLCDVNNKGLSSVYYITVQNFPDFSNAMADLDYFYTFNTNANDIAFNLKAQIVSQEPIPLSNNVPITGSLETDVYVHFKFDVPAQTVENSWLTAHFYFDTDTYAEVAYSIEETVSRYPEIFYYMHYVAAGESVVKAGRSENCLESDYCEPCYTDPWNPECYYQISPCEYRNSAGGTYYISVHTDYVKFFDEEVYFTVNVKTENIVELLTAPTYAPVSSYVFENTAEYYSLSVPALPANTAGWVLSVRIAPVNVGEISISLKKIAPGRDCECAGVTEVVTGPEWLRYYPCEITPGSVYYLTVEGVDNINDVLPVSYSIHARLIPVEIRTINLSAGTSPIAQTFNGSLTLNWNQFVTYQFTVNAIAGTQIAVEVDSDDSNDDLNVFLSTGKFATSEGTIGSLSDDYIYTSSEICDVSIDSCILESSCDMVVRACSVPDTTNQVWFLTFTGEDLVPLHSSGNITFKIRVINPSNTFVFPTSTISTSNSFTVENNVDRAFGVSNYVSTNFTSLAAGNSLRFTLSGSGATGYIRYAAETGSDCSQDCQLTSGQSCEIFACSTVTGGVWYFSFVNSNGALDISLNTVNYGNTTVQTIQSSSTTFTIPTIESNHWQYYQVSGPANTAGQWDLEINPSANVYTISGTPFLFPGFFPSSAAISKGITPSGVVSSCGVSAPGGNDGDSCCYPAFSKVFAVQPTSNLVGGTIDFEIVDYVKNSITQSGSSWNTTNTLAQDFIATIQFSVAQGAGFWIEFRTNASASIYLNRGSRAGNDGDSSNYAKCWDNFASTNDLCGSNTVSNAVCRAFIDNCYDCVGSNVNSNYFITILAINSVSYSVSFVQQSDVALATPQGSQTLFFPSSQIILDPRSYQASSNVLYTHFTFDYTRLLTNNIVNFIPYRSDLPGFLFPNVNFQMNQIRLAGSPDNIVGSSPLVLFVNSLGSGCNRGGQVSNGASLCMEGGGSYDSNSGNFSCSVSVCDLSCSGLYWSVGRANDNEQETRYQFNFAATEVYSGINQITPTINIIDINLSSPSTSTRISVDAQVTRITYYRVRVGSSFALAGVKNYPSIEFSFDSSTSGTLSLGSYDDKCTTTLQTDVTSLTAGSSYIYHYDPMDFEDEYGNSVDSVFYIRADVTQGSGTYSLNATWTINTVQVISANVNAASPYSATKEIFDNQWQFFEFTTPLTGYDTLRVEVDNLCCASNSAELDVYYSFGGSIDVARPRRYPTETTYISSDVTDSTETIDYTCDFYGGIYRVSVYAPEGTQLEDAYPAIYDISATVTSIQPRRLAVGCTYTIVSGNYFELEPEANNRGSQLVINADGPYTKFLVSRGSRPYDGYHCEWDDLDFDYDGYYGVVEIGECEYDDKWFIYIEYPDGQSVTLSSIFYHKYIPTVSSPHFTTTADIYQDGAQYYKVVVPDGPVRAFRASLLQCDGDQELTMTVKRGNFGFSGLGYAGTSEVYEDSCLDGASCYDLECTASYSNGITSCGIYDQYACEGDLVYFIGIFASSGCSDTTTYTLDVTTDFVEEILPVYLDVSTCHSVDCFSYFQVFNADGTKPDTTFSTVSVTLHNPSQVGLNIGVSTKNNILPSSSVCAGCADEWFTCSSEICTYELCSYGGDILMLVTTVSPGSLDSFEICRDCPAEISILVEILSKETVVPLSVGSAPSTAAYSSYTLSSTGQTVEIVSALPRVSENHFCEEDAQSIGCNYLFPSEDTTTYYFYETGVQLASPVVNPLSTTATSFTLAGDYIHFSYTPSAGRKFKSLEFSDLDYRAIDTVNFYIHYSTDYVPFDFCEGCSAGASLSWSSCSVSYSPSVCYAGTIYFSICVPVIPAHCDVSFKVRVVEEDVVELGSSHLESNFRSVSQSVDSSLCVSAPTRYSYFVDVTGPLFVGVREAVGADLDVTIRNAYCDDVDSCDTYDDDNDWSSCTIHNCEHCWAPGRYEITVDVYPYALGYSFDIIAINQYIPLSSSVQTTIGRLQHFYSYTSTSIQSLVFNLDVITGPAVEISIFEGCNNALAEDYGFYESVVCAFGSCHVYIPTQAKRSSATTFYIHITSSTNNFWPAFIDDRNDASSSIKETQYSLSVSAGTSNCIAASSIISEAEFCGSVFRNISGVSLWSFEDVTLKDEEAECMYNNIAEDLTCPLASAECLNWLKTLSCLIVFPQCDSNGFQTGVCRDVCSVVDERCGDAWEKATAFRQYDCNSDFYVGANVSSTCYPIPPPPPPPSSVEDYRPVSAGPAVLDPFDVPVFSDVIIYLTTGQFHVSDSVIQTNSRTTLTRSEFTSIFSSDLFGSASVVVPSVFATLFLILIL